MKERSYTQFDAEVNKAIQSKSTESLGRLKIEIEESIKQKNLSDKVKEKYVRLLQKVESVISNLGVVEVKVVMMKRIQGYMDKQSKVEKTEEDGADVQPTPEQKGIEDSAESLKHDEGKGKEKEGGDDVEVDYDKACENYVGQINELEIDDNYLEKLSNINNLIKKYSADIDDAKKAEFNLLVETVNGLIKCYADTERFILKALEEKEGSYDKRKSLPFSEELRGDAGKAGINDALNKIMGNFDKRFNEAYELGRKSREAAAKQENLKQEAVDQVEEEKEAENKQGSNVNMGPPNEADNGNDKGKEKEENGEQGSNVVISSDSSTGSEDDNLLGQNTDQDKDREFHGFDMLYEQGDVVFNAPKDKEKAPNSAQNNKGVGSDNNRPTKLKAQVEPVSTVPLPETPPMPIGPQTVSNAFDSLKTSAEGGHLSCTVNGTSYNNVMRIQRVDTQNLLIHHCHKPPTPVVLHGDTTKALDENYKAAAKSLGRSIWYHFARGVLPMNADTAEPYRKSFPELFGNDDIFSRIAEPQKFRGKIAEVRSKLALAKNDNTLSQIKYAEYEKSLQEVEKWLDAIDEYSVGLAERGISGVGTHYRKEQEKRAFVIIKSLCVALVGLAVGYFGMLELAISQGWILQGVAPGTTVLAQGQDAMIELYRQLLATNPEFILIAAISAAVLAIGAVAVYHYFRDAPEPLTKEQQEQQEQQEKHDRLMKNPIEFFECFSKNKDEARTLFTHQEVIQMLSGVVINEAKHPNSTGVAKQHIQDVSDTLCNIYHELEQQMQTNAQQISTL